MEASGSFNAMVDEDPLKFRTMDRVDYYLATFHGDGKVVLGVMLGDLETLR